MAEEAELFQYIISKPINYCYLLNILTYILKGWKLYHESNYFGPLPNLSSPSQIFPNSKFTVKGLRTLLVDDDHFAMSALKRILKKGSLKITECDSGNSAIKILENQIFDLGIFDYQMPGMDGITLIKYVREKEQIKDSKDKITIIRIF